jgi:hypothetical protein
MSRYFTVQNEITRHYRRFNAEGRELTVRLTAPPSSTAARHFIDSVDALFEYFLRDLQPSDMVDISINNADNQQDRPIGLSFRRRDQISRDVMWSVFEKVTQSNARYQALDTLTSTCIQSRCLWVLARRRKRRKADLSPQWLILRKV